VTSIDLLNDLFKGCSNYDQVKNVVEQIKFKNLPAYPIIPGILIYRGLPIYKDTFTNAHEISFNPNPKEFGRAHTPSTPIFYGATSTQKSDHPVITIFWELNPNLRNNIPPCDEYELIIGRWIVKRLFNAAALTFHEQFLQKNPQYSNLYNQYKTESETGLNDDFIKLCYFSDLFAKSHNKNVNKYYYRTAAFTDSLLKRHPLINGIIYPSVRLAGEGTNIVIETGIIDTCLILDKVFTTKIYLDHKGNAIHEYIKIAPKVEINGDFKLIEVNDVNLRPGKEKCLQILRGQNNNCL
jgi:hypothetical protein